MGREPLVEVGSAPLDTIEHRVDRPDGRLDVALGRVRAVEDREVVQALRGRGVGRSAMASERRIGRGPRRMLSVSGFPFRYSITKYTSPSSVSP